MGSAASVWSDIEIYPEISALMRENVAIKKKIAISDGKLVQKALASIFKDHKILIVSLTSRTKSQLQTMLTEGNLSRENLQKLGGGLYGKFFANLATKAENLDALAVEFATSGIGCDEVGLANIFGCMTSKEVLAVTEAFALLHQNKLRNTKYDADLVMKLSGKLGKSSEFARFMSIILKANRQEGVPVDPVLAAEQVKEIHAAGAARTFGVDSDVIFDILCHVSREQCVLIRDEYVRQFSMPLDKAITKKFSASAARALILWTKPKVEAVLTVLQISADAMMADSSFVESTIARYDKLFLDEVDALCRRTENKSLYKAMERALSGNLAKAVRGWLLGHSPDGGKEGVLPCLDILFYFTVHFFIFFSLDEIIPTFL
jgi:hypothetical protein